MVSQEVVGIPYKVGDTLDAVEDQREEVVYLLEAPDFVGSYEQHAHREAAFELVLGHHLATGSAWSRRHLAELAVLAGCDGNCHHRLVRPAGACIEQGCPLRT